MAFEKHQPVITFEWPVEWLVFNVDMVRQRCNRN